MGSRGSAQGNEIKATVSLVGVRTDGNEFYKNEMGEAGAVPFCITERDTLGLSNPELIISAPG